MDKRLNSFSGKGRLLAEGRDAVMAYLANHTQTEAAVQYGFLRSDGSGNGGALSNALLALGWRESSGLNRARGAAKAVKIVGCLPRRLDKVVLRTAGRIFDTEDPAWEEPSWWDFRVARSEMADGLGDATAWMEMLVRRLKGDEMIQFENWIASNEAADAAAAQAAAKAATATLKPKCIATLRKAQAIALEFDAELAASIQQLILKCVLSD